MTRHLRLPLLAILIPCMAQAQYQNRNALTLPQNLLAKPITALSVTYPGIQGGYNFNAIAGGNMTVSSGETEGRLLVAGNMTVGSTAATGCDPATRSYTYSTSVNVSGVGQSADGFPAQNLIVGGGLTFEPSPTFAYANWALRGVMLHGQGISYAGPEPATRFQDENNTDQVPGIVPSSAAIVSYYQNLSDRLSRLPSNGSVSYTQFTTTLTGNSSSETAYIFNVDYSQMRDMGGLDFVNINPGASVLLNVTGADNIAVGAVGRKSFQIGGLSIADSERYVLFNLPDATTFDFGFSELRGSILAPSANASFQGGSVSGMVVIGGNISGCSGFEFHNPEVRLNFDTVLPVTLSSFSGALRENAVQLNWATTSEANSSRFVVERAADARNFMSIGEVAAAGENNALKNYDFTDRQPGRGINYYRLKLVDQDGSFAFSKIVSVQNEEISLVVAPNPVTGNQVTLQGNIASIKKVKLFNTSGKFFEVKTTVDDQQRLKIESAELGKRGLFLLHIDTGSSEPLIVKVLAQ